jgi:hypothetical protein
MAKRSADAGLPYFKFVISKWLTGDITDCTLSAQGLFINLCALYWSKSGNLTYTAAKKKFPRQQKRFDELIAHGILKLNADQLSVSFLAEQLEERGAVSVKNSEAAKTGWNKRKSDAPALQTQSERNADAMPIEENRKEEKRREESRAREADFSEEEILIPYVEPEKNPRGTFVDKKTEIFEEIFTDDQFVEGLARSYPGMDYARLWENCWNHHSQKPTPPEHGWQWKQKFRTWLDVESKNGTPKANNLNGHSKTERNANSLRESWCTRPGD